MAAKNHNPALYGTIPDAARRFGLGLKLARRKAREGAFPVYDADTCRPRVCFAEVERWLRSTRVPELLVTNDQAAEAVDRVLERERAA